MCVCMHTCKHVAEYVEVTIYRAQCITHVRIVLPRQSVFCPNLEQASECLKSIKLIDMIDVKTTTDVS